MDLVMPSDFICRDSVPARQDDENPLYTCYRDKKDKNLLWCVRHNTDNPADHIYVGYPYDTGSEGYAGRWLVFPTIDGTTVTLQGPWHSNSDALFEHTGIDVRNQHYVQLVVGLSRDQGPSYRTTIKDIVYYEPPGINAFNVYKSVLRQLYEKYHRPLYYWHGGSGGSTYGTYGERDYV